MVSMPRPRVRPLRELGKRALLALLLLMVSTFIVWLDRGSYVDNIRHDGVSFIDALYYSTVTMTTTGYGDITPLAPHARLLNAILITPMRVGFLVLLVGTTIAVLADEGSRTIRDLQWRQKMRNHVVVIGYGTKGRSAINTLRRHGEPDDRIVVIDSSDVAVSEANLDGLAAFLGDATRRDLLRRAEGAVGGAIAAALGATAYAGIPLTHRDCAQSALFVTGHSKHDGHQPDWRTLALSNQTLVVYMGTLKAAETAEKLMAYGRSGDTPVAIVSNGTLPHQSVVTGCLKNLPELAENAPRPALIVIGEVVSLRDELKWFQENPVQSCLHTLHEQAA